MIEFVFIDRQKKKHPNNRNCPASNDFFESRVVGMLEVEVMPMITKKNCRKILYSDKKAAMKAAGRRKRHIRM